MGKIEYFTPGRTDIPLQLKLPRKLYGRKTETDAIKAVFEDVCGGRSAIIFISGYAGIGKTMLIQEALRPAVVGKGYFIAGKFDQLRQDKPFAPLASAFGDLVRQLLSESQDALNSWRKRIRHALGRNGAVITELIPEVEQLVGVQSPIEPLPPQEAQNRFFMVFGNFLEIFAQKGHPLVLFLDDLHWADSASLQLLQYLSRNSGFSGFLLAGAYRSNEIDDKHPLNEMLRGV